MENQIEPGDTLRLILTADKLPTGCTVTKKTGNKPYTFRRDITIYVDPKTGAKPQTIKGFFLVDQQGNINQIEERAELVWEVRAEMFVDDLKYAWEFEDK